MKRLIVFLLFLFSIGSLYAQWGGVKTQRVKTKQSPKKTSGNTWIMDIGYNSVLNNDLASDAVCGKAAWYFDVGDVSIDGLWGDAELALAPKLTINLNSGMLNNGRYSEQIALWAVGVSAKVDFSDSELYFDLESGELYGWYTMFSGYEEKRKDWILSATLKYDNQSGRNQDEWFASAWSLGLIGSLPKAPQKVIDWGYNEFTHRLATNSTNTYSVHADASVSFDIFWSDDVIEPIMVRGLGGKYNANLKYLGLGIGTEMLYYKKSAITLTLDHIWGWDNTKLSYWNFGLDFHLDFFQKLWYKN